MDTVFSHLFAIAAKYAGSVVPGDVPIAVPFLVLCIKVFWSHKLLYCLPILVIKFLNAISVSM